MRNNFLDNPLGTDGFEFVEFTGDNDSSLGRLFESLGFAAISRYRSKAVLRYKQGNINFLLNMESKGPPAGHGPDAKTFEAAIAADTARPNKVSGTMAFMFETRRVIRPTRFALESDLLQPDY
jgi:4-hydroxyphenylpyruvate dioxygenase-like putative hemolysin